MLRVALLLGAAVCVAPPALGPPPPEPLTSPTASAALPNGLHNPMPGGIVAGYPADTGLDINGFHMPVYALAAGTLVYSEAGHTAWATDDRAVLLKLDKPLYTKKGWVTHLWYAHLWRLRFHQPASHPNPRHVAAGELLGISGVANRSPHLHLGMLLDGETRQSWGSYLLDDAVREALGGWRRGQRLPAPARSR